MPPELAQWINPAILILGFLYLDRSIRNVRVELRQDMAQLRQDMKDSETRLREDMKHLDGRVARLEHGQAKLEGLLEGLREAITQRHVA